MSEKKAKEIIYENTPIDSIMEMFSTREFVEVIGKAGGDVLTYRVYNDGYITQK